MKPTNSKIVEIEGKLSHYRQPRPGVNIPVIDVRDGLGERMLAESILKASNVSQYIRYNQYHQSRKTNANDTSL